MRFLLTREQQAHEIAKFSQTWQGHTATCLSQRQGSPCICGYNDALYQLKQFVYQPMPKVSKKAKARKVHA